MSGLLSVFDLEPIQRAQRLAQIDQQHEREAAAAERREQTCRAWLGILRALLGEHLDIAMDEHSPVASRAYAGHVKRFKEWCIENDVAHFPACPETVSMFFVELAAAGKPYRHLVRAQDVIGDVHRRKQASNPCDDALVRATLLKVKDDEAKAKRAAVAVREEQKTEPTRH